MTEKKAPSEMTPEEIAVAIDEGQAENKAPDKGQADPKYGKFGNDTDKVWEGYQEVEKAKTRAEQQKAQYRQVLESQGYEIAEDGTITGRAEPTVPATPENSDMSVWEKLAEMPENIDAGLSPEAIKANAMLMDMVVERRINPLYEDGYKQAYAGQKDKLRKTETDFAEYEDEIDKHFAKTPLVEKAKEGAVNTALDILRGRKYKELQQKAKDEGRIEGENKALEDSKLKEGAFVEGAGKPASGSAPVVNVNTASPEEIEKLINQHKDFGSTKKPDTLGNFTK